MAQATGAALAGVSSVSITRGEAPAAIGRVATFLSNAASMFVMVAFVPLAILAVGVPIAFVIGTIIRMVGRLVS